MLSYHIIKHITDKRSVLLFFTALLLFPSCKKFITLNPPPNRILSELAFSTDATATAAITGIYSEMMNNNQQFSAGYVTILAGLAGQELSYFTTGNYQDEFKNNNISLSSHSLLSNAIWSPAYKYIYAANLALEKISVSTTLSPNVKSTLIAEAKFIRSFCYFYLVNLFSDVPLITKTDYTENQHVPRTSVALIYQQIIKDLEEAKVDLSTGYIGSEKTRPNKWSAFAMLARVQLYNKNWEEAEKLSTEIIASGTYALLTDPRRIFLKNSAEAIWQLQNVNPSYNTWEGKEFLPSGSTVQPTYFLSPELIKAFENGDIRKAAWDSIRTYLGRIIHIPAKYRNTTPNAAITEYYMVLRLAEQYLIRSEARAQQSNISGAQQDINIIRSRAGLGNTLAKDKVSLLLAIEQERQIELMAEWGHRWMDLKRTGRASAVIGSINASTWQATDVLWPLPQSEINLNPLLVQNQGY